ncbi:PAS domain S-box protein [Halopseudomonas pachastrellae]|nr:PAS domain S-box protein [Halopseudomonas pachastrellae]
MSEQKFSRAFPRLPDGLLITRSSDGMLLDVNDGFCLITGYSRERALGQSTQALQIWRNADDRKRMVDMSSNAMAVCAICSRRSPPPKVRCVGRDQYRGDQHRQPGLHAQHRPGCHRAPGDGKLPASGRYRFREHQRGCADYRR